MIKQLLLCDQKLGTLKVLARSSGCQYKYKIIQLSSIEVIFSISTTYYQILALVVLSDLVSVLFSITWYFQFFALVLIGILWYFQILVWALFGILWYFQVWYWYYSVFSDFTIGTTWYFVVLSDFGIGTIWYFMVLSDFGSVLFGILWYFQIFVL